ncbi:hypothetical protein EON67_02355 [archaeon]|nr:MAG: hypothetical protein EON67_02355 [archaeon]
MCAGRVRRAGECEWEYTRFQSCALHSRCGTKLSIQEVRYVLSPPSLRARARACAVQGAVRVLCGQGASTCLVCSHARRILQ